jgi:hypothetical protein
MKTYFFYSLPFENCVESSLVIVMASVGTPEKREEAISFFFAAALLFYLPLPLR